MSLRPPLVRVAALLAGLFVGAAANARAATITIVNKDAAGLGLDDATPVSPVGGNTGTTLGAQRLIVFKEAARIWGSLLPSNLTISVATSFASLPCSATSAILGQAGATNIFSGFSNAPVANTWYVQALANKLANAAVGTGEDISAQFNADFGTTCTFPRKFYMGLDNNHGTDTNLLTVVLHELGHGLGFTSVASAAGSFQGSRPSIYDRNLLDLTTGKTWDQMTTPERVTSSVNAGNVVWKGPEATTFALATLSTYVGLRVSAPPAAGGSYGYGAADFGPALAEVQIATQIVAAQDPADGSGSLTTDACSALTNASAVAGKIALVDRGTCAFAIKVKNAQNAGALAVIVANNTTGLGGMTGGDATITIPSIMVSQSDGAKIRANLPATAALGADPNNYSGADASGRLLIYTPSTYASGSSVSHWDTSASPNLLMEPNISQDLPIAVDATLPMFRDIGWFLGSTTLSTTWVLPSSAHAQGANNAFYTTDLTVSNTGAVAANLTLKFLGHDGDGTGGAVVSRVVPPGQTATYPDVLSSLFGVSGGFGALRVAADTNNLKVVSQTSTPPPSGIGTFGQAVPAATGSDFVTTAGPKALFSLRQDAAFRTNAVIANATEAPAHVDLNLFKADGSLLGAKGYDLDPLGMTQIGKVILELGGPDADGTKDAFLVVSTPTADARIATYAAVIDQNTNDPRTILPVTLGALGANAKWLLPSSAHAQGANSAFYTTDVTIGNTGSSAATVTLKFLGHDQDGSGGAEVVRTVPPNSAVTYTDVLGSLFGVSSGFGAVLFTSTSTDLRVLSQTSTPPPNLVGTFGQSVPAAGAADFVTLAASRMLVGLRNDSSFRTNVVIANATDKPAHVDLALASEGGAALWSSGFDLRPYEMHQVSYLEMPTGFANAALSVSTPTPGARVATYAAIIDQKTNDPRTVLP